MTRPDRTRPDRAGKLNKEIYSYTINTSSDVDDSNDCLSRQLSRRSA
jgi:hypothetical protein